VGAIGESEDEGVLAAMLDCITDSDEDVRCAVCSVLPSLARRGNIGVVRALIVAVHDEDSDVRRTAVVSLGVLAKADDETALAEILSCLHDSEEAVRTAALDSAVGFPGGGPTVKATFEMLLLDQDTLLRCTAIQGLSRVIHSADACTTEKLALSLEDPEWEVRETAHKALAQLTQRGDSQVQHFLLEAVLSRCRHGRAEVRVSALETAIKLLDCGRITSVQLLLRTLDDDESVVRAAAERLVASLMLPAPQTVRTSGPKSVPDKDEDCTAAAELLAGCLARLEVPARKTQRAAIGLLTSAWPHGCKAAAEEAQSLLHHKCPRVRRAALDCFVSVSVLSEDAQKLQPQALARIAIATVSQLTDTEEMVTTAAVHALVTLKARCHGEDQTFQAAMHDAVRPVLSHRSPVARCAGIEAVAAVAGHGDVAATELILTMVRDPDEDVRWSLQRGLLRVAPRGHTGAVQACIDCAQDEDEQVRIAAVEALASVTEKGHSEALSVLKNCCNQGGSTDVVRVAMQSLLALMPDKPTNEVLSDIGAVF